MEALQSAFGASLRRLGLGPLPCDLFARAPCALRFAIGGPEKIYLGDHRKPNGAYIENAVERALTIYDRLPAVPTLLRIDECPDLVLPGLPRPDLQDGQSAFWALPDRPPFLTKLLREIIRAELDAAGIETLTGNVWFLNPEQDLLFQVYDDRSAVAAAAEPALLQPLAEACRDWILEVRP